MGRRKKSAWAAQATRLTVTDRLAATISRKRNLIRRRLFRPKPAGWQPALPRKIRVDPHNPRSSARKEMPDVNLGVGIRQFVMCSKETLEARGLPNTHLTHP